MGDAEPEEVLDIPADVDMEAPFDASEAQTPTVFGKDGACWKCSLPPVQIVAPAPASVHEALSLPSCVVAANRSWALCCASATIRLGVHEFYIGPNRRRERLPAPGGRERRRF